MKYLASWWGGVVICSVTSGCFDLVGWCCRVMLLGWLAIPLACDLCLAYLCVSDFKHQLQKILLVEKIWLVEKWTFFITENFLGISDILCLEAIHKSYDFLSLTLAVVGSTSGSCYFLQQCQCLRVCVLCVLVVRCVKSLVDESEEIWCITITITLK